MTFADENTLRDELSAGVAAMDAITCYVERDDVVVVLAAWVATLLNVLVTHGVITEDDAEYITTPHADGIPDNVMASVVIPA